ncbi:protein of unknown function [Limnospira indica PCC 8005]|uniref:Uncharacterized protein n=1 Tax=Limnospira indica PCC 8005 TaxID=376219 RepID=A0A9P1KAF6_9CYAN|nr:protein of unknown function [Limnospira indica PCC 8005]
MSRHLHSSQKSTHNPVAEIIFQPVGVGYLTLYTIVAKVGL